MTTFRQRKRVGVRDPAGIFLGAAGSRSMSLFLGAFAKWAKLMVIPNG